MGVEYDDEPIERLNQPYEVGLQPTPWTTYTLADGAGILDADNCEVMLETSPNTHRALRIQIKYAAIVKAVNAFEIDNTLIKRLHFGCSEMLADLDRMDKIADEIQIDPKYTPDGSPRLIGIDAMQKAEAVYSVLKKEDNDT